ncbi:MAG: nucleotidyl transferase AbiEii/AbiGii toxin family protein [Gammaproteobacteria bacterium]|nr:nucleotidyl transferase AbiEii/AbiGii toxin family protein [Gammaproteobacteria bacterium]
MPRDTRAPKPLPDWEQVLSAATQLQTILPDAVLVGGTAAAVHAGHRFSQDADHVLTDLREHFDEVLAQLESVAGWKTARAQRPVLILGSLDGIETGVRQLIRQAPLETAALDHQGVLLTVPTAAETLRIKGLLILRRNATRDYLDFAALSEHLGVQATAEALRSFDSLYPQESGESALQQLQIQLANPVPYDLDEVELQEYKQLDRRWHDWESVKATCASTAIDLFDRLRAEDDGNTGYGPPP